MSMQNIFDNEIFFGRYENLRSNEVNANNLIEIPALLSLLPDIEGKKILDLGCGFGEHCKLFVEKGAEKVVGLDISKKMLKTAKLKNQNSKIEYINLPMENLSMLNQKFDLAVSSLAFHYIESYEKLIKDIYNLLVKDGFLIFSQEHPLLTCHSGGERWTKNDKGMKLHANISNYGIEGKRNTVWFVENVEKYHRTFSTIVNTLIDTGFKIEKIIEPLPDIDIMKAHAEYRDLFHRPDFLLIKAEKL